MRRSWLPLLALAAIGAVGCRPRGGTDVGNGATATFDLGAYHPASRARSHAEHGARVDTFLLAIGDFRMRRGAECDSGGASERALEGPLVGDLVREDAAQESELVELAAGAYCMLRASTRPLSRSLLPDDVVADGVTIFVSGVRADGAPFTLLLQRELNLELLSPSDDPIDVRDASAFVLAFDVDAAVASLDLDTIEELPIRIDATENVSRLSAFANSLRQTASLFVDENEDGVLGRDESDDEKSIARGHL